MIYTTKRFSLISSTAVMGTLGAGLGGIFGGKPGAIAGGMLGSATGTGMYYADKRKKRKDSERKLKSEEQRKKLILEYTNLMNSWKSKNPQVYKELSRVTETDDIIPIVSPHQLINLGVDYLPSHIIPLILKYPLYDGGEFLVYDTKTKKYGSMIWGGDPDFSYPNLNIKNFLKDEVKKFSTKRFSLKGAALYGGGYIVGGLAGEAVGKKIGEHIKRELGPEDLNKTEAELKELRKFLEVHKNQRFSGLSVRKYEDNPEICRVISLNGVSDDNPDDYDFGMMNKNKAKITKSIQEEIKAKEEILRNPKNHPGNYGDLGRKIGGTIGVGGGLLAAHKLKKFSSAGREWAGFKGGMKGALKGAKWGAILAPGNLIAAGLGHPKTALGITAAGSVIGGGIGFKLGRDSGISEYKYKNDPEYKEKIDKEREEECKKKIKYSLEQDLMMANEFSYKEWGKLAEELKKTGKIIPKELLDYIKFYETTWKKNIKLWYDNVETKDQFEVVEFKEIFPLPISSKTAKEWLQDDDTEDLYILTVNDAGDDGWGCYNFKTKGYGWDGASYGKLDTSLKKFISNHTKRLKNDYPLSKTQKELTEKFLRSI